MSRFDQGYICAISCIVNGHGASVEAKEALLADGIFSRRIAKARGADPYDIKILNGLLKEIETERNR